MSLRDGSRARHNDMESLDMAVVARLERKLVVYLVYKVDVANIIPDGPALPCPCIETKQSNMDPHNRAECSILNSFG